MAEISNRYIAEKLENLLRFRTDEWTVAEREVMVLAIVRLKEAQDEKERA